MTKRNPRRTGFTLIELLIVIGIIVIIATLGFLFMPNLNKNRGVPNATTQVEGWFNLSKQQALRDKKPHGIRLLADPPATACRCAGSRWTRHCWRRRARLGSRCARQRPPSLPASATSSSAWIDLRSESVLVADLVVVGADGRRSMVARDVEASYTECHPGRRALFYR